jgi:hypothetical protein
MAGFPYIPKAAFGRGQLRAGSLRSPVLAGQHQDHEHEKRPACHGNGLRDRVRVAAGPTSVKSIASQRASPASRST